MTPPVALAAALLVVVPPMAIPQRPPDVGRTAALIRFKIVRDFNLHFTQDLGAAETKRRVMARFEALQKRFADKVSSSTLTWAGDEAEGRVQAFGQTANAHVSITSTTLDLRVHLPLLLAPLGGNIQAFLDKTGREMLE